MAKRGISGKRYAVGQKRCQVCEIFINWDGKHCPCCGYKLRTKPRNIKYKQQLHDIQTNTTLKTIYVGPGKDPKLNLFIDPEYLKAVPRLSYEQFEALKESIREDGLHEPITVNQIGKVLDGHTRYQICSDLGIPIKYIVKKFQSERKERRYVKTVNLKRRQLNTFQQYEMIESLRNEMIFERTSEKSKKMWATRKGLKEPENRTHYKTSTDKQISEITGMGVGQIEACVYVKAHGTPELIQQVRDGEFTPNRAKTMLLERNEKFYQSHMERKVDQTPDCPRCGAISRRRRGCHVHSQWCCTKCIWGK